MPKLPPLAALRAFESAARLKSVSQAADELNVSHPAISHQIKKLESYFGQPLLIKKGRGITTTKEGDRLSATLTETFEEIRATCSLIEKNRNQKTLVVASVPSIASHWLIPLLPIFAKKHPDVQIRIVYALKSVVVIDHDIDILIYPWDGPYDGPYKSHLLLSGTTRPVCSRSYLERTGPLDTHTDWTKITLLHDHNQDAWREWFASAGIQMPDLKKGVVFDDFNLMSTAAIAGQGVALCPVNLIHRDITRNHLEVLSDITANRDRQYLLLHHKQRSQITDAFRDWLLEEVNDYFQKLE